jgi:Histidine kinase
MASILSRDLLLASWQSWVRNDLQPPQGPAWLQWGWTLLFSLAVAGLFTVLGFLFQARGARAWPDPTLWARWYGDNLVVCATVSGLIHGLYELARRLLGGAAGVAHWRPWLRTALLTAIPVLGLLVGWPLGLMLAGFDLPAWLQHPQTAQRLVAMLLLALLVTLLMTAWSASQARRMDAERRSTEAQLRLLQGQIEPHFLFNTLAGVVAMIEDDPPRARRLLQDFTDYLRAALGALRQAEQPLAQELELVGHYLALMHARMEDRLQVEIDADDRARQALVPPLLLQPLVENAVVHGLEPRIDGGLLQVQARVQGGRLVLAVQDDGRGPGPARAATGTRHHGMALDNLRARLQTRYGANATLTITAAAPGTRVVLDLPWQTHS